MNELYADLVAERAKYGTVLNDDECVNLLNSVAWKHRPHWGLTGKDFGAGVGTRYDGTKCSHDTLLNKSTNLIYDVLESAGASSQPQIAAGVLHTQSNRPWVPAIEPREPTGGVTITTKLGATLFSLVDLFQYERQRGDETIARLRDDMGCTFLRPFWRKGSGANSGDYWNNGGYRSLVRPDLSALPVSLMKECRDWVRGHRMKLADCIFADWLINDRDFMSTAEQDRFCDGFLEAATAYPDTIEYVEIFNEPYTMGGGHGGEMSLLQHHARRVRQALGNGVLVALGTPYWVHGGDPNNAEHYRQDIETEVRDMHVSCPEVNLITVHFSRVTNRPPELGPWAPGHRASGEPRGPDSSVAETKDANTLAEDFRATTRGGYGWYVYHDDRLIRPRGSNIWERPEWPAIATALKTASGSTGGGGSTSTFPRAQPYTIGGSMERGGFVGNRGMFVRIDPGEAGQGLFGGFPVHVDRENIGAHEGFELTPVGGGKFSAKHLATESFLGMDATQHSADLTKQLYTVGQVGAYESLTMVTLPSGSVIAFVEYNENGRPYASAPLTWVRA